MLCAISTPGISGSKRVVPGGNDMGATHRGDRAKSASRSPLDAGGWLYFTQGDPPGRPPVWSARYGSENPNIAHKRPCASELCAGLGLGASFRGDFYSKRPKNGVLTVNFRTGAAGGPSSSSTRLLNRGERGPPCGVPSTLGLTNPFSITPALRNGVPAATVRKFTVAGESKVAIFGGLVAVPQILDH
jgi:hypothetical protein